MFGLTTSMLLAALAAAPAEMPANTWVAISRESKPAPAYSSVWYLPATDEFFTWGKIGGHRYVSKRYEVQTLRLADDAPAWADSLPMGKEETWAGGTFPNWGCHCHRLRKEQREALKGPWSDKITDSWLGTSTSINVVRFVETDGVVRPTRCYTFNQATYDTKRNRLLFYVGGKTFAYDPKARAWTDLKATPPLACEALAWASLCYDPEGDQAVLFGGGYCLNPWGGAKTWIYDCAKNTWRRPTLTDGVEPPVRCNARLVYDSKNRVMVLFGGDAMDRFLADTWVFDPAALTWTEQKPAASPPPLDRYAACFIPKHGVVLLVTHSRRSRGRDNRGGVWTYETAGNVWTPIKGAVPAGRMEWISCDYSPKDDVVLLTSSAGATGTWLYRFDPENAADEARVKTMVKPGAWVWNSRSRGQMTGILGAPEPDRDAVAERLKDLPANTVVDTKYPGALTSKTWSTAIIDTDRGTVVYIGGGHSGYNGNDIALYDVGTNRWAFDAPPCFIPLIYNYNAALFGWGYRQRPTSQHTYLWYAYDRASKTVVYCPRHMGVRNGMTMMLEDDPAKAITYDRKKHADFTWVYRPADNTHFTPVPGRPFGNAWSLALVGTPKGVFAKSGGTLWHADVTAEGDKADVKWTVVDKHGPALPKGYGGEFQPLVYDSKRNRLLYLCGGRGNVPVLVWEHPLEAGAWKRLETTGPTKNTREVVYDAANDCLIAMPERALMVMDCATNEWKQLDVAMPKGRYGTECAMVYDPVHRVCVMLVPTGFSAKMGVYVFRYDPATAQFQK